MDERISEKHKEIAYWIVKNLPREDVSRVEPVVMATVQVFVHVLPPEKEEMIRALIIASSFSDLTKATARSKRPGHLLLNWKSLFEAIPDITLAVAGAATLPNWAIPLAALYSWNKVDKGITRELSPLTALTLLLAWDNCNAKRRIGEMELVRLVAQHPEGQKLHADEVAIQRTLTSLAQLRCIEIDAGEVWLREWIQRRYE